MASSVMESADGEGINIDVISFIETKNIIDLNTVSKIRQAAYSELSVAFTSMNAAEAVIDVCKAIGASPEWTIYTLGGITHTILKDFFTESEIFSGADNAEQLGNLVIENEEDEITFFCGNQRRDDLPAMLQNEEIKVAEIIVYETIETPVKIDKDYQGILFFSPSAAKSFFSTNKLSEQTVLFAIGQTTAKTLKPIKWKLWASHPIETSIRF